MPIKVSDGVSMGKRKVKPLFVTTSIFVMYGSGRSSSIRSGRKVVCDVDVLLDGGKDDDTMGEEVVDRWLTEIGRSNF